MSEESTQPTEPQPPPTIKEMFKDHFMTQAIRGPSFSLTTKTFLFAVLSGHHYVNGDHYSIGRSNLIIGRSDTEQLVFSLTILTN